MKPSWSVRNLTPSSTAPESFSDGLAGTAVGAKALHGQSGGAPVVKLQVTLAASGFPARSRGPLAPPSTVTM